MYNLLGTFAQRGGSIAILSDNGTEFKNTTLNEAFSNLASKEYFLTHVTPKATQELKNLHNFLKRTLAKFLESSGLEWDELPFACYCFHILLRSNWAEPPFSLMHGHEPAEGQLTHLNNCSRYSGDNKGQTILAELHKLWKHHAAYLKEICNRKDDCTPSEPTNNSKFKIRQGVMVRNHAH